MLYLIDANVLIRAHEDYYPLDRVPQYWQWLEEQASKGTIKMPFEIFIEIASSRGPLSEWIREDLVREALVLHEELDQGTVDHVLSDGYGKNLTDSEIEKIGQDPFLIGYAILAENLVVVTKETSRPNAQRANRKIPEVCDTLKIRWIRDFDLYRRLQFSTGARM